MKTFKDKTGKEWTIEITIGAVKRVRDLLGINLTQLAEGTPPLITRLADLMLLVDTIYCIVKPDADKAGITDVQFGSSLDGDAIKSANDAFWEDLENFTRSLGRPDEAMAIKKQRLMMSIAVAEGLLKIESSKPEELIQKRIAEIDLDKMINDAMESKSATNSPASSASTPT